MKNTRTAKKAKPPKGRLIQKHQRQESLSVNAPPKRGPTTEAMPNMLDRQATYMALVSRGTEKLMMFKPPEKTADAPIPAMARPTMSIGEFLAAAHTIEPAKGGSERERRKVQQTFKDNDGNQIGILDIKICIDFSKRGLKGREGEQICGAIPADIFNRVEN